MKKLLDALFKNEVNEQKREQWKENRKILAGFHWKNAASVGGRSGRRHPSWPSCGTRATSIADRITWPCPFFTTPIIIIITVRVCIYLSFSFNFAAKKKKKKAALWRRLATKLKAGETKAPLRAGNENVRKMNCCVPASGARRQDTARGSPKIAAGERRGALDLCTQAPLE